MPWWIFKPKPTKPVVKRVSDMTGDEIHAYLSNVTPDELAGAFIAGGMSELQIALRVEALRNRQ